MKIFFMFVFRKNKGEEKGRKYNFNIQEKIITVKNEMKTNYKIKKI